MSDNQPIRAMQDSDITAWAEFADTDGNWWRCNEDGEIGPAPPSPRAAVLSHPLSHGSGPLPWRGRVPL